MNGITKIALLLIVAGAAFGLLGLLRGDVNAIAPTDEWQDAVVRAEAAMPTDQRETIIASLATLNAGMLMPDPSQLAAVAEQPQSSQQTSAAGRPVPAEPRVLAASIKDGTLEIYFMDAGQVVEAAVGEEIPSGWVVETATLDMVDLSFDNVQLSLDIVPDVGQNPAGRQGASRRP